MKRVGRDITGPAPKNILKREIRRGVSFVVRAISYDKLKKDDNTDGKGVNVILRRGG